MTKIFNVAIIGGGIGREHIDGYIQHPDKFRLAYVCDLNIDRAKAGADLAPDCVATTDMQQVLNDPEVDIVDVCLPPHMHYSGALAGLNAGKHVVGEKPLAGSVEQVKRLREVAASVDRRVFPVFQYRYGQGYRTLHSLKQQGWAGKAYTIATETHWQRDQAYYSVPWRGTWKGELGGAVVSHACHIHNLATHLCGNVVSLAAMLDTRVNEIENDDCASIIFRTAEGVPVSSSITLGAAGNSSRFRACFEHLTATSDTLPYRIGGGNWTFTATDPARQAELDALVAAVPPIGERFGGFVADMHASLTGQQDLYLPSFDEGAHSVEVMTAIYDSHRNGTVVTLPLSPNHAYRNGWQPEGVTV